MGDDPKWDTVVEHAQAIRKSVAALRGVVDRMLEEERAAQITHDDPVLLGEYPLEQKMGEFFQFVAFLALDDADKENKAQLICFYIVIFY